MPGQMPNQANALNDLSDINLHVIETVAEDFIRKHGSRSIHTGQTHLENQDESMESELRRMLTNPTVGIRQVIPAITFWITEFKLQFEDALFELERKRLLGLQSLADDLEKLVSEKSEIQLKLTLSELLTELDHEELYEAIPALERHVQSLETSNQPAPKTPAETVSRLRTLLQFSTHEIDLVLHDGLLKNEMLNANQTNKSDLEEKAQLWLERHRDDKFEVYIDAYQAETIELQKAIDRIVTVKPSHFSMPTSHTEGTNSNLLKKMVLKFLGHWRHNNSKKHTPQNFT
ncbi:MAG: hypothetical protein R3189_09130 [Thiomicrorhabdus chilensis]|uniref:hypothetical protein n=1 Tax=Thiomicrorhabdus chilensis TaxID=63656 RepID=UPI00299EBF80|nr:hypothetical protein [Thiomicrorhabdus chilensis]MDX1348395.1 hypothetical protein [Thiomicrorhabdus chilensis]